MTRALLLLVLLACGESQTAHVEPVGPAEEIASPDQQGRSWRRMDIDQLDASLKRVTGGFSWTEEAPGPDIDLFDKLSGTLGKPEYLDSTTEDLVPGLLFQKFLGDAATSACTKLVAAERTRSRGERTLMVHVDYDTTAADPAGVDENLRRALLVFHGRDVAPDSPELQPWRTVVDDGLSATGDPERAWRAVCVALVVHPDFYSY